MTTNKIVAERLRKSAADLLADDKKGWRGDKDMIDCCTERNQATLRVAKLIESGKTSKALEAIDDMDTSHQTDVAEMVAKKSPDYYKAHFIDYGWPPVNEMV